jgi:phytoene dehydrogenase-like protein
MVRSLLSPFPPVRGGAQLAWAARRDVPWLARLALLPVRSLGEETFAGDGGRLLLAGNALHADLTPEQAGSGLFGTVLCGLAQDVGFPAPVGGAGALTDALVRRLEARGGEVRCGQPVTAVEVEAGRAVGVTTAAGFLPAARAVLASVSAPALYQRLLAPEHVPARTREAVARWQPGAATIKVDWALDTPIPWADPRLGAAGTVHLADSVDALSRAAYELSTGRLPDDPFVLLGQMTTVDPSRSPEGTEAAWAYTHGPQELRDGPWDATAVDLVVRRMEAVVERWAPGFGRTVRARHVQGPRELEAVNPNLVGGDLNNGTAQLHQQLVFRPVPGLGRAETPVDGLYLASAAAHPGGGVHGACGANAARAAVLHDRMRRAGDGLRGAAGSLADRVGRTSR